MPRKKSAPRKAPEKTPPPEPKRRGRRKKETEPQPADMDATEPESVVPDEPGETETATPEPADPAEPDPTTAVPTAPAAAVTADEAALVAKYATHQIVPGSLRYAGGREGWGHKRTVEVRCCACPAVRVVATSDLQWDTTRYCLVCVAAVKRNRRAKRRTK